MTEEEVLEILYEYFNSLFPKVCPNCAHTYDTLSEYIKNTERLGPTISYDADNGDWQTRKPVGSFAFANCPCGTTLVLSTNNMPQPMRLKLLEWLKIETLKRDTSPSDLLDHLRDEIRRRALVEPGHVNNRGGDEV